MKKIISTVLAVCLVLSLAACSGQNAGAETPPVTAAPTQNAVQTDQEGEWRWVQKSLLLPEGMAFATAQCLIGGRIYLGGIGETAPVLGWVDADGSASGVIALPAGYDFVYGVCASGDGITVLCGDYPAVYFDSGGSVITTTSSGRRFALLRYGADGELSGETPLTDAYEEPDMNFRQMLYADGAYLLLSQSFLLKIGEDGTELGRMTADNDSPFLSMCETADGVAVVRGSLRFGTTDYDIVDIDADSFTEDGGTDASGHHICGFGQSSDGRFVIASDDGVYYLDTASGETEDILSWNDIGLSGMTASAVTQLPDGGFLFFGRYSDTVHMAELEYSEKVRTELTLASAYPLSDLYGLVNAFNSTNEDYKITVVKYGGPDNPIDLLQTEIIAGNAPDLYAFYSNNVLGEVEDSGVFEDLLPYLDADPDYGRDTFIPGLFTAMTGGGNLFWLPYDFCMVSFIGPESVFGDRDDGITMEEMDEIVSDRGGGTHAFPGWMSQETLLTYMASFAVNRYVDYDAGTCDFEDPDFIALLEKCREQPEDVETNGDYSGITDDGLGLLQLENLQSLLRLQSLSSWYNGDYSFVGFPNEGSNGSMFRLNLCFAISSTSQHKDAAWAFLRSVLSEENQLACDFLPATQSGLDTQIGLALSGDLVDTGMGSKVKIAQADADKFMRLIDHTTYLSGKNITILEIICDEAGAFFAGDKTAEETAAVIQSRASIYLAEHQ